jgi:hypothetical protein
MATQNSLVQQLEPARAKKPRKSTKAPGIKAAVITSRVQGKSKRSISMDLGITRNTVDTILEESNIEQHLISGETTAFGLMHKSLDVLDQRLSKGSESAATYLLSNTLFSERYSKKATPPADVVVNLAIQNLIQPSTTTNSDIPAESQPETRANPQVIDCTPPSKT